MQNRQKTNTIFNIQRDENSIRENKKIKNNYVKQTFCEV